MVQHLINRVRKEQTLLEAQRLQDELVSWLCKRRKDDKEQQYSSQLAAIESVINGAIEYLRPDFDALDPSEAPGQFYERCRLLDLRIVWLRRVWDFFKEKFDQRDDKHMGPLLRAADEVVWSCYRQVFTANDALKQGPAPLPFIESHYSPEAFPAELVPGSLRDGTIGADFLRTYLNRLPIPVVRLPPACVVGPWWLIYVGHEIGHHIQYDLDLVAWFRERVEDCIIELDGTSDDAEHWGRWSQEIFADIFSVLAMGQWAVAAMTELELSQPNTMLRRRSHYPSPAVRLQLLANTAGKLGLDGRTRVQAYGLDLPSLVATDEEASKDAAFVSAVIEVALGPLPDLPYTLPDLVMFRREEFLADGPVEDWSRAFLQEQDRYIEHDLRTARLVTSATLGAWAEIAQLPTEQDRARLRQALAKRALEVIVQSREEGTRAAKPVSEVANLGADLASLLRQVDRTQLEIEE